MKLLWFLTFTRFVQLFIKSHKKPVSNPRQIIKTNSKHKRIHLFGLLQQLTTPMTAMKNYDFFPSIFRLIDWLQPVSDARRPCHDYLIVVYCGCAQKISFSLDARRTNDHSRSLELQYVDHVRFKRFVHALCAAHNIIQLTSDCDFLSSFVFFSPSTLSHYSAAQCTTTKPTVRHQIRINLILALSAVVIVFGCSTHD